jgi:N-acetylglucosamine kinase-like BadF-type ATPase
VSAGPPIALIAVDGGNSKADLALVAPDGSLLSAIRGPTISHQARGGTGPAVAALRGILDEALVRAGVASPSSGLPSGPLARVAVLAVAGADTPRDRRRLRQSFGRMGLAEELVIVTDARGALRAGTDDGIGVAVICGSGSNMFAVGPSGRVAAYPALGEIAGDWGGGGSVGPAGLAAAVRGRDGRGQLTSLERLVPAFFGLVRPIDVTLALYRGRLNEAALRELAPVVFEAASAGDPVARSIVDRQADEIVAMAVAALRRVRALRTAIPVVLAGGIFKATDRAFHERIRAGLAAAAPRAEVRRLTAPPVLGAALLGLDALGLDSLDLGEVAAGRLRAALTEEAIMSFGGPQ